MELRDYLRVIRVRKWVILQAVIVVTVAALAVSLVQTKTYESEARVLISENDTGAAIFGTVLPELSSQPERGLQTQVQLLQLRPLAESTVRKLNLSESPDELLKNVEVSSVGQTNIITVKATDSNPQRAADVANTLAQAYVDWSRESKRASIKDAADEVQNRLDTARADILDLGRRITAQGKSDELSAELQMATGAYTTLAQKLEELRVNEQLEVGSGAVVGPAVVASTPVSPNPLRNTGLGLAIGLVFGLGMALLYEYLDNTIKTDDEAEKFYGVPVLGHIPFLKIEKGQEHNLAIVDQPGSATAESFRLLRNSLDFINFERNIKTLLITSSAPGEGKSTVAANLAASLAQAGSKVALISCDFRRPTTESFFNLPNILGLSDVLLGRNSLKSALQRPGDEQLVVLTSGKMPPNPSELLGSSKMQSLIESVEEWADWVVIDTPPLLAVSDGATVARWADAVLLVSRSGKSTRETALRGAEMLGNVGAKVIGVVVSGADEGAREGGYYAGSHYYNRYYSYYYSYRPQGANGKKKHHREHLDSGAKAPVRVRDEAAEQQPEWVEAKSPMRAVAETAGRVLTGALAFLVVLVVAAAVAYLLDGYFHWGLVALVTGLLR